MHIETMRKNQIDKIIYRFGRDFRVSVFQKINPYQDQDD